MSLNALIITCSTKILTLAIIPFLLILVGLLCEFDMVPGAYILLSPQEEEVRYSSWGQRCTHSAVHSSKRFKPCLTSYGYAKIIDEKKQIKNSPVLWCL